jgi:ABC-type multidrug transport system ATPase subunit
MHIQLTNIGKRYNYEWIFRGVNLEYTTGNNYAILGSNGSGKSTLLQVIAGSLIPSEGDIRYMSTHPLTGNTSQNIAVEDIYTQLSFASPYLELLEELTLTESIAFHAQFKPFFEGLDVKQMLALMQLEKAKNKQLKYFSSGMKQRVRLALAILSNTPLLLLDEPTSNLDKNAINWYQQLIQSYSANRLIIVASNQLEYEYAFFCKVIINVEDFKKRPEGILTDNPGKYTAP